MKKIRHSVFETNSSSTHTISISGKGECSDTLLECNDGVCEVYGGEFGWGPDVFTDAQTKASYCLTWVMTIKHGDEVLLSRLRSVLEKHHNNIVFVELPDYNPWGYIDHQSDRECEEAFATDELLERFIFNSRSILLIDNDNR